MTGEIKKALSRTMAAVAGVLGLVLFRWTPETGKGILLYVAMIVIVIAIALAPPRAGYWPGKHDDR